MAANDIDTICALLRHVSKNEHTNAYDERNHVQCVQCSHIHSNGRRYMRARCTASALKIHCCWAVCVRNADSSLWFLFSSSSAQLKSVSLSYFERTVTNHYSGVISLVWAIRIKVSVFRFLDSSFRCLRTLRELVRIEINTHKNYRFAFGWI